MKIECTKFEWAILLSFFLQVEEHSTCYYFPGFQSIIKYGEQLNDTIKIEGKFIDEQ
jgi:hypothetical protein